ncbi:MAG: hypothetical protein WDM92_00400 [Caulobacteraceae bacterium]
MDAGRRKGAHHADRQPETDAAARRRPAPERPRLAADGGRIREPALGSVRRRLPPAVPGGSGGPGGGAARRAVPGQAAPRRPVADQEPRGAGPAGEPQGRQSRRSRLAALHRAGADREHGRGGDHALHGGPGRGAGRPAGRGGGLRPGPGRLRSAADPGVRRELDRLSRGRRRSASGQE